MLFAPTIGVAIAAAIIKPHPVSLVPVMPAARALYGAVPTGADEHPRGGCRRSIGSECSRIGQSMIQRLQLAQVVLFQYTR
jgi:hypothetical protein